MIRDAGRVSVFFAIAFAGLLAIVGVVVDASGQLRTLMRADNLAAEAARAAGQAVDTTRVRGSGELVVDRERAIAYAAGYLAEAGHDVADHRWSVQSGEQPGTVDIEVTLVYETRVLRLFGLTEQQVTADATAVLVTDPS